MSTMGDAGLLQPLGLWLEALPAARYVADSAWAFPTLEALHVLCLTTVFGSIAIIDLRLMGLGFRRAPVTRLAAEALPVTWFAFAGAVATGGLLLISQASAYLANDAFRFKMLMLALAGLNMLIFQRVIWRSVAVWDARVTPPAAARVAGALSLALWIAVIALGRWIGFTLF